MSADPPHLSAEVLHQTRYQLQMGDYNYSATIPSSFGLPHNYVWLNILCLLLTAGGLTAYYDLDYVRTLLPTSIHLVGLSDAG